jgi:AcrR family transcriptional regulator
VSDPNDACVPAPPVSGVSDSSVPGGSGHERSRQRAERSDGLENRQRILAAATIAVARDGVKVPLAAIASEAGVGIGTLYRHFPSRASLLEGLVVQSLRLVVDAVKTAAEEADTAIEAVRGYRQHYPDVVEPG